MCPKRYVRVARRVLALGLILMVLQACGGTIMFGRSSKPSAYPASQARSGSPLNQGIPSPVPGTTAGFLLALDGRNGNPLWQVSVPMAVISQPVVSGDMVFIQGGYDCRSNASVLAAFDAKKGNLVWEAPTTGNRYGYSLCGSEFAPMVGSGIALTNASAQSHGPPFAGPTSVSGLDQRTGRTLWNVEGEEPAAGAGVALVLVQAPTGGFKVRALDPMTGGRQWDATVHTVNIAPTVNRRVILVQENGCPTSSSSQDIDPSHCSGPGQTSSFVSSLDPATGRRLWQVGFGPGSQVNRSPLLGDVAVFTFYVETPPTPGQPPTQGPPAGAIRALDPATGAELWSQGLSTEPAVPILAVSGTVFVQSTGSGAQPCTERLDALDSKTGILRWRMDKLQACVLDVAADEQTTVLTLSTLSATKIVVLNTATGAELWEAPIATTGPYRLAHTAVSGGVVYAAASGKFILPPPSD
jgi:outer membrane protein assembly factor BamB